MFRSFPFHRQRDAMDCGPTCLMMIADYWGKKYSLPYLRERAYISRDGVSAQGIIEAAEHIGLQAMAVKAPFDTGKGTACFCDALLPCIVYWNRNHFVVAYKTDRKYVWIADPAAGKFRLSRAQFEDSWLMGDQKGVLILLEPTPRFYDFTPVFENKSKGFRAIFLYLQPHRALIWQVFVGMAVGSILLTIAPFLTQSIVDFGIEQKNIGFIYVILVAQLALFFSQTAVQFIQNRILLFVGARMNVSMVYDFLAKLTRLPVGFFDAKMTGDLMQRIGDQARIELFLTHSALPVLFSSINFLVFTAILLVYSPFVFGIFIVAAMLYVAWILFFLKRRKELDYVKFKYAGENSTALIELIQGMQEIKLQGSERKRRQMWASIQAKLFHTNLRALNLMQWQELGAQIINQGKSILITFTVAKLAIEGRMTFGMMLAVQYMIGQLEAPLQHFVAFIRAGQDARISLDRMNEINDIPDEDALLAQTFSGAGSDGNGAGTAADYAHTQWPSSAVPCANLVVEQVSFRYNQLHDNVLEDVSIVVPVGKVTAIVGASGSGKTTLLKLLLGIYAPTRGQIRAGSIPLASISPQAWRKRCGCVMQDGFIFSDTIANNITESDERPDISRLLYASAIANIQDFIDSLPLGYNSKIGAQGNGLSQGQKQRILIARAVYKNPDYLFFDEATNALDANNEKAITENLHAYFRKGAVADPFQRTPTGKTVVVVAHRLSTVRHADQILVLSKGRIVETGTHNSLIQKDGHYFNLVKNQLELGS